MEDLPFETITGYSALNDNQLLFIDSEGKITPYILKVYDPELDKDELDACNRAFDSIEQGDWSNVVPFDHIEFIMEEYFWKHTSR